jgi:hypothetical protein
MSEGWDGANKRKEREKAVNRPDNLVDEVSIVTVLDTKDLREDLSELQSAKEKTVRNSGGEDGRGGGGIHSLVSSHSYHTN